MQLVRNSILQSLKTVSAGKPVLEVNMKETLKRIGAPVHSACDPSLAVQRAQARPHSEVEHDKSDEKAGLKKAGIGDIFGLIKGKLWPLYRFTRPSMEPAIRETPTLPKKMFALMPADALANSVLDMKSEVWGHRQIF